MDGSHLAEAGNASSMFSGSRHLNTPARAKQKLLFCACFFLSAAFASDADQ